MSFDSSYNYHDGYYGPVCEHGVPERDYCPRCGAADTITRLTKERDEARAKVERVKEVVKERTRYASTLRKIGERQQAIEIESETEQLEAAIEGEADV